MVQNIKRYILEGYDKDTEELDNFCDMFYESPYKESCSDSYNSVIKYKNRRKSASGIYTDNETGAVCI